MSDVKATDMKTNRVRVQLDGRKGSRRYLFGVLVNEHGFLSDGGQVYGLTTYAEVSHA